MKEKKKINPLQRVFYRPYIGRFSSLPIYDNRRPSTAQ
nr:MAG TPA: hypothetical protein [Caudoviricetes sp.]